MTQTQINSAFTDMYPQIKSRLSRVFGNGPSLGEERVQEGLCIAYKSFSNKASRTGEFLTPVNLSVSAILNLCADRRFATDGSWQNQDVFSHKAYKAGKVEHFSLEGILENIWPLEYTSARMASHIGEALSVTPFQHSDFRLDMQKFLLSLSRGESEVLMLVAEGYSVSEISRLRDEKYRVVYSCLRKIGQGFCKFFGVNGHA